MFAFDTGAAGAEMVFATFDDIMEGTAKTLGVRPPREDSLLEKMKKLVDERLGAWKAKIEEGVSNKSSVIIVEEDINISHLKPIKKRSRPSESTSTNPPASKKTKKTHVQQEDAPPPSTNEQDEALALLAASGLGSGVPKSSGRPSQSQQKGKGKGKAKASALLFEEDEDDLDIKSAVSALGEFSFHILGLPLNNN